MDLTYCANRIIAKQDKDNASTFSTTTNTRVFNPIKKRDYAFIAKNNRPDQLDILYKAVELATGLLCASKKHKELFQKVYKFYKYNSAQVRDPELKGIFQDIIHNENNFSDYLLKRRRKDLFVNFSEKTTEGFAKFLSTLSKRNCNEPNGEKLEQIVTLIGDVGEGKTYFINFILSVYMETLFNQSDTIAIKLDLANDSNSSMESLGGIETLLHIKTLRILKKYYFLPGTFSAQELVESYKTKNNTLKKLTLEYFNTQLKDDGRLYINDHTTDHKIIKTLFEKTVQYIKNKLCHSFLFIIDGLDSYLRDKDTDETFSSRVERLIDYIKRRELDHECHLLVLRPESYLYIKSRMIAKGAVAFREFTSCKLCPIDGNKLLIYKINKISIFLEHMLANPKERIIDDPTNNDDHTHIEHQDTIDILTKHTKNIQFFFVVFLRYSLSTFEKTKKHKIKLKSIFGTDLRSIVTAVRVMTRDFLFNIEWEYKANSTHSPAIDRFIDIVTSKEKTNDVISRHKYITLRSLMLNNFYYCHNRYTYSYSDSVDSALEVIHRDSYIDCALIPDVFQFGNISDLYISEADKYSQNFLIKIRILQALYTWKDDALSIKRIIDILTPFNYHPEFIKAECKMLYSLRCISLATNTTESIRSFTLQKFSISTLGEHLITKLIHVFSYYENIVDNTYVPIAFKNHFQDPLPLKTPRDEHEKTDFNKRIAQKSIRVLRFISMLARVECIQQKMYREHPTPISDFNTINVDELNFSKDAMKMAKRTIVKIANSSQELTKVFNELYNDAITDL